MEWEFKADTGTLIFTKEGDTPPVEFPDNRPWVISNSTNGGTAIKKIVFEKAGVLPNDYSYLVSHLSNLEKIVGFDKFKFIKRNLHEFLCLRVLALIM